MSVSESLALLRESAAVNRIRNRSLLHTSTESSKIPLSEQAAVALNSLRALSQSNGKLLDLAPALLLLNPTERESLDSETESKLSNACVLAAIYLSPIFPLRHAQRVYEWLVNGMQSGVLGSNAEFEALFFSALPFHATTHFPTFIAALESPSLRKHWRWLVPISRQQKPATLSYFVQNCPAAVHLRAIDWASSLIANNTPSLYSSSVLVNITARWAISASQSSRTSVALHSLKALDEVLARPTLDARAACGHLVLLSICASKGLDSEAMRVFGRVLVKAVNVFLKSSLKSQLQISLLSLNLLFMKCRESCLSNEDTFHILKLPVTILVDNLSGDAPTFYAIALKRLLSDSLSSKRIQDLARNGNASNHTPSPQNGIVVEAVKKLLELYFEITSTNTFSKFSDSQAQHSVLESTLSALVQSKFEGDVQLGIKRYLDSRDVAETRTEGVWMVERLISFTLASATSELNLEQSGIPPDMSAFSLIALLGSPSRSLRLKVLLYFYEHHEQGLDSDVSSKLWTKLMFLIDSEPDYEILSSACSLAIQRSGKHNSSELFQVLASRLAALSGKVLHSEDSQFLSKAVGSFLTLCESLRDENTPKICSFLAGGALSGLFSCCPRSVQGRFQFLLNKCFKRISNCDLGVENEVESADFTKAVSNCVIRGLDSMSYSDVSCFLLAVSKWKLTWLYDVVSCWLSQSTANKNESQTALRVQASLGCLQNSVTKLDAAQLESIVSLCLTSLLSVTSSGLNLPCAILLWKFVLCSHLHTVISRTLCSVTKTQGLDYTLHVLKQSFRGGGDVVVCKHSLRWYIGLVLIESSKHKMKELLNVVLIAYFGNDRILRSEVLRFCTNALRAKFRKKVSGPAKQLLMSLPSLSGSLPDAPPGISSNAGLNADDVVYSYLRKYIMYPCSQEHELPSPLLAASPSSSTLQNLELSMCSALVTDPVGDDLMPLLRALEGYVLTSRDITSNMCSMLKSLFERISSEDSDSTLLFNSELIARCVSFLATTPPRLRSNHAIEKTLKAGMSAFSVMNGCDSPPSEQVGLLRLAILTACSTLLSWCPDKRQDTSSNLVGSVIRNLCSQSVRSSTVGDFAINYLDSTIGLFVSVADLLIYIRNLRDFLVRYCVKPNIEIQPEKIFDSIDVGIGALSATHRYLGRVDKPHTEKVVTEMKSLVREVLQALCADLSRSKQTLEKFWYNLLLSILGILRDVSLTAHGCTQNGEESFVPALFQLLRHYQTTSSDTESNINASSLRSAVFDVLDVSDATQVGHDLISETLHGLVLEDSSESKVSVPRFITFMDRSSDDVDLLSKVLLDSVYRGTKVACKSGVRSVIAPCLKEFSDPKLTLQSFLNGMASHLEDSISPAAVGNEYALWLVDAKLSVTSCLEIILQARDTFRCHIVSPYFMQPATIAEVSSLLHDDSGSADTECKSTFEKQLCQLLLNVVSYKEQMVREDAARIILAMLPLSALHTVLIEILGCTNQERRLRGLIVFTERLAEIRSTLTQYRSTQTHNSDAIGASEKEPEHTIRHILETLCARLELLCSNHLESDLYELQELARATEVATKCDVGRDNNTVFNTILKVVSYLQACIAKVKTDENDSKFAAMACSCFSLFSTSIAKFKERAISIIPMCLDISISYIETVFGCETRTDSSISKSWIASVVSIVEGAIRVCVSVIDSAPLFFGEDTLERLCVQVLLRNTRSISDVVNIALEETPLATSLNALQRASERSKEPCLNGLACILRCLGHCIEARSKAEVKAEGTRLLEFGIACLEKVNGDDLSNSSYSNGQIIDETFGDFAVTLALRLPESEFEKVYKNLIQWSGTDTLYETAEITNPDRSAAMGASILRLVPFYCATDKLFQRLGSAMVPYFMKVFDNVISVISDSFGAKNSMEPTDQIHAQKKGKLTGKKRKVISSSEDLTMQLSEIQNQLQDICVKILTAFLTLSPGDQLDESLIAESIPALLLYFDRHQGTPNRGVPALCALGVYISKMCSLPDINERGRQLLMLLSRELLSRTRSSQAEVRQRTLVAARSIAVAVGVEYIVTIPESLPVVAEVIDDEDTSVRIAAKGFVTAMESISGERLLNQIS